MDIYLQQQVRLENLKEGEARKVVKMLDEVHTDLVLKLEASDSIWSRERYTSMIKAHEDALDQVYKSGVLPKLKEDGLDFVSRNQAYHYQALSDISSAIVTTNLSAEAIYTAAMLEPMQGKLMEEWAVQLSRKEKMLVSSTLRNSWIQGESINKAAKALNPVLNQSKRGLAAITRTYYGHLAANSRDQVWNENSDIVEGVMWDSILDGRTTTDICAPRDQLKYTLKGEPIDHNLSYLSGPGQAHWNCRSMSMPIIKGVKAGIQRQAVGAGSNYQRGDNTTRTGRARTNSKYNRDKGILKETTVGPRTDYEAWLKRQPKAFQQDVLGVGKAEAFRSGEWSLGEKFIPQNPITIDQF
jgi:hypothetical protein